MGKTLKFLYFSCGISFGLPFQLLFTPLKEGFMKKSSCSFGFCPNEEGGRALPKIVVHFLQTICWVNLGMGREGETSAQIFWHIGVQQKWYKLSKLGGGGVEQVIWTKSKRTATYFFREALPKIPQL